MEAGDTKDKEINDTVIGFSLMGTQTPPTPGQQL